jgi:dinuclear metal center YbgI/SA1388 family protein
MKTGDILRYLDRQIPPALQEGYDNSGLQAGNPDDEAVAALVTIDVTEDVVDEAFKHGCNIIISHHPVIFSPLKRVSTGTTAERIVMSALRKGITIYSAHTSLDSVHGGVSFRMAGKLGLKDVEVLSPVRDKLVKLVTFLPHDHLERVRDALFSAGAGHIGNYDRCGFHAEGSGSFRGSEETSPFVGEKGEMHSEPEARFETILPSFLTGQVVKALLTVHPYEEPAFDLYPLLNEWKGAGLGCVGTLEPEMDERSFLELCKKIFSPCCLRHTSLKGSSVKRVALCGGAGFQLFRDAMAAGADAFVTGDVKYHQFAEAAGRLLLVDAGHYETEKYSTEIIYELLIKKFPNFALRFSETNTNPINCY